MWEFYFYLQQQNAVTLQKCLSNETFLQIPPQKENLVVSSRDNGAQVTFITQKRQLKKESQTEKI